MIRQGNGGLPHMHKDMNAARNEGETVKVVLNRAKAIEVFAELYELLEEYRPAWYGEDLHARAQDALRPPRAS
jgi:hypothetical protein